MLPEAAQSRKAIWQAVNPATGIFRIDEAFPKEIVSRKLENEMMIEFVNGATWQLIGSDNYQNLIGSSPRGLVFSEYATSNPGAWAYLSPILAANNGWALFITTPRGTDNHAHIMYQTAKENPDWFAELLPATETSVFTPEQLAEEKKTLIALYGQENGEAHYRQEYLVSFAAGFIGSYYNKLIEEAEAEGRIGRVPHDPALPVYAVFDLGVSDASAIWFIQQSGKETWAIDYLEHADVGMDWYAKKIKEGHRAKYNFSRFIFPHDARQRELSTGKSRLEILYTHGITPQQVLPPDNIADGINSVRMLIPRMWFDAEKCKRGLECLRNYSRRWDDVRKVYSDKPYHDQYSHGADSLRYYAMANVRNAATRKLKYPNLGIV